MKTDSDYDSAEKSSEGESQRSRGGAGTGGGDKKEDGSRWSRILRVNILYTQRRIFIFFFFIMGEFDVMI